MNKLSKKTLDDLQGSGLSRKAAEAMQIREVVPEELYEIFKAAYVRINIKNVKNLPCVQAYEIPYFDLAGNLTGYYRYKLLDEYIPPESKKPIKYLQLPGSKSQIYFPPFCNWKEIAKDTRQAIYIVEGEKKAAALTRLGFPAIGLGGVWSWCSGGDPISDFGLVDWKYRKTPIVFDADV